VDKERALRGKSAQRIRLQRGGISKSERICQLTNLGSSDRTKFAKTPNKVEQQSSSKTILAADRVGQLWECMGRYDMEGNGGH